MYSEGALGRPAAKPMTYSEYLALARRLLALGKYTAALTAALDADAHADTEEESAAALLLADQIDARISA